MGKRPVEVVMAIDEVKLQGLEVKDKAYQEADGGGLFIEILPDGTKFWRLRYQLADKEKVTLGKYPTYSLAEARQWRTECRALIKLEISPRALKRGDITPNDVKPEAKELANVFLNNWYWATVEKNKLKDVEIEKNTVKDAEAKSEKNGLKDTEVKIEKSAIKGTETKFEKDRVKDVEVKIEKNVAKDDEKLEKSPAKDDKTSNEDSLEAFAQRLDEEIAELSKIRQIQEKDVISAIGDDQIVDIAVTEELLISENRNVLKRLFAFVRRKK